MVEAKAADGDNSTFIGGLTTMSQIPYSGAP